MPSLPPPPASRQHSREAGALVLAPLPPFSHGAWLGAGLLRMAHELSCHDLAPRVVRPLADLDSVPAPIREASWRTLALQRPIDERRADALALAQAHPQLYTELLDTLLAGPERLFAFSAWRTNVDLCLELSRQLKQRRPDALILLGGPEAIERGVELRAPWVDIVVSGAGEGIIVPLVRAVLDGQPGRGRRLAHTWVAPRHDDDGGDLHSGRPYAELGPVDYAPYLPLVLADSHARLPTVLNVGCVFNCGFCTNRLVYPELGWGAVETCTEEIRRLGAAWAQAFPDPDHRPPMTVEMCDATINGWPDQFAQLCQALAGPAAHGDWRPGLSANVVVDQRLDAATAAAAADAGFVDLFFGLESGSDRIRRAMKKPGSAARVWTALEQSEPAAQGRLHMGFGVIVGWPDETEAEYHQTVALLERIATLEGWTPNANVSPLFRTPNAQGADDFGPLEGDRYGVLWRGPGPAGDPAVRCRRMMGLVERFHGVMAVDCPVPVEHLARWMLPAEEAAFVTRWEQVHSSRAERSAADPSPEPAEAAPPPVLPPAPELLELPEDQALDALGLEAATPSSAPVLPPDQLRRLFDLGPGRQDQLQLQVGVDKAEVRLLHPGGQLLLALVVRPRDPLSECFARTTTLNVSLIGQRHSPAQLALAARILKRVKQRETR